MSEKVKELIGHLLPTTLAIAGVAMFFLIPNSHILSLTLLSSGGVIFFSACVYLRDSKEIEGIYKLFAILYFLCEIILLAIIGSVLISFSRETNLSVFDNISMLESTNIITKSKIWSLIIAVASLSTYYIFYSLITIDFIRGKIPTGLVSLLWVYFGGTIGLFFLLQSSFSIFSSLILILGIFATLIFCTYEGLVYKRIYTRVGWIRIIAIIVFSIIILRSIGPSWDSLKEVSENYTTHQILEFAFATYPIAVGVIGLLFSGALLIKRNGENKYTIIAWIIIPIVSFVASYYIYLYVVPVASAIGTIILILFAITLIL